MAEIAVIDDNIVSQRFLSDVFAERGWDVVAWPTAEEAFDALFSPQAKRPDVIILDLHLHTRDSGLSVLSSLKTHEGTRDIPVVMSSGDVWALQSLPKSVQEQLAAILVKPFEIDEAYKCIEFVLEKGAVASGSNAIDNA